jgi:endothelin-converting enzyme/putative endopeptidase
VAEWFAFQVGVSTSASELSPRWRHCVDATTRVFGFAVGGAFGRKFLGPAGRDEAAGLAAKLLVAAQRRVALEPWLDVASRGRAAAGLGRLALQVGYPDAELDYGELRVGRDTYFRNLLAAGRFEVGQQVARAARPLDRTEWFLAPTSAEARYWPGRGVIAIPAGALQPPLFDRDAPQAVEFGSAGAAIGKELARAVLDQGAGGSDAGPGGAWSETSRVHLQALAGCVAKQLELREQPLGPSGVLAEEGVLVQSLADAGGLRFALEAMDEDRSSWPAPVRKLAGFTPEQQFFVGWAQSLCEVGGEGVSSLQGGAEVLPGRLRVNGALSELPEFAAAFRCGGGAAMVLPAAARCQVW